MAIKIRWTFKYISAKVPSPCLVKNNVMMRNISSIFSASRQKYTNIINKSFAYVIGYDNLYSKAGPRLRAYKWNNTLKYI